MIHHPFLSWVISFLFAMACWYALTAQNRKRRRINRLDSHRVDYYEVERNQAIAARRARAARQAETRADAMRLRGLGVTAGYGERA